MRTRAFALLIAFFAFASPIFATPASAADHAYMRRVHAVPAAESSLALFSTETAAQAHCPKDEVVWLNTNSGIWHEKGMRWYGNTKYGAYVCKREAAADGDRDTLNGQ